MRGMLMILGSCEHGVEITWDMYCPKCHAEADICDAIHEYWLCRSALMEGACPQS